MSVAVAGNDVLNGVGDLVGGVAYAVLHAIEVAADLVASFLHVVASIVRAIGGNCLVRVLPP